MIAIRSSTIEKLLEFKRAGGVVVFLGTTPQFTDTPHKDKAKIDAMIGSWEGAASPMRRMVGRFRRNRRNAAVSSTPPYRRSHPPSS